jgi:integrase
MRTHVGAKRKARTLDSYETLLRRHILPAIGGFRVTDIRRAHVSKMHADLAAHAGAANRALSVVSAIWNWAAIEHEDLALPPNPAKGIKRNPEEGRERFLSSDELARLGDALEEAETVGLPYTVDEAKPKAKHAPKPEDRRRKLDPFAIAAVRLLILTGARLREILTAKWGYVDFERGLMNLPTSKTGRKSVFLSAAALEVLSDLHGSMAIRTLSPARRRARLVRTSRSPGPRSQPRPGSKACASMTFDTALRLSALVPRWACRSSANCWDIRKQRPRIAMPI